MAQQTDIEIKTTTAVEWFRQELLKRDFEVTINELYEQAKQMEKEQIEQARAEGYEIATSEAIKEIHKNYRPI